MSLVRVVGTKQYFTPTELRVLSLANVVDFYLVGDSRLPIRPISPKASTVFVRDCDKNFVYFNISNHVLPSMKTLFLYSHPCEYSKLVHWNNHSVKVYSDATHHWLSEASESNPDQFKRLDDQDMLIKLSNYENQCKVTIIE